MLWGWAGERLTDEEPAGLEARRGALDADLGEALGELLTPYEVEATRRRVARLLRIASCRAPRRLAGHPLAAVLSAAGAARGRGSWAGRNRADLRATFEHRLRRRRDAGAAAGLPHTLFDALRRRDRAGPGSRLLEAGWVRAPPRNRSPGVAFGSPRSSAGAGRAGPTPARGVPGREVVSGSFETWPPGERSYDLVYEATAWTGSTRRCATDGPTRCCGRTATWRSGGRPCGPGRGDPFFTEIQDVYDEIGEGLPADQRSLAPG